MTEGISPPKAAQELAKITFGCVPCRRQISRIVRVASKLTDIPKSKSSSAPALTTAAKWKMLSVEIGMAFSNKEVSVISPVNMVTRGLSASSFEGLTTSSNVICSTFEKFPLELLYRQRLKLHLKLRAKLLVKVFKTALQADFRDSLLKLCERLC